MTWIRRALASSALAGTALVAAPLAASAQSAPQDDAVTDAASATAGVARAAAASDAVYVLSNQAAGNAVLRFDRQRDGSLVPGPRAAHRRSGPPCRG